MTLADTMNTELDREALNRLRWIGWIGLGSVALLWISWVSVGVVDAGRAEVRQETQYEQLREDLAEIKSLLRELRSGP